MQGAFAMLVTCQSCAQRISDQAQACPKCGASGDFAFGKEEPCRECGNGFRASWFACQTCGAPALVAIGSTSLAASTQPATLAIASSVPESSTASGDVGGTIQPREAHLPGSKTQRTDREGFARGSFGKIMSYVTVVVGFLMLFVVVRNWYLDPPPDPAYPVGQLLGTAALIVGAVRAIDRTKRTIVDWICAIMMFIFALGGIYVLAFLLVSRAAGSDLFLGGIVTSICLPPFVVGIRLLRQPHLSQRFRAL